MHSNLVKFLSHAGDLPAACRDYKVSPMTLLIIGGCIIMVIFVFALKNYSIRQIRQRKSSKNKI